jgi:hypothetical protein
MNGALRRGERSWIASAVSSLPVPDSPEMNTLASVFATLRMVRKSCCMASQVPTISSSPDSLTGGATSGSHSVTMPNACPTG